MRVIVTGGAGFIGSHLTDDLVLAGHDVTVIDDLSTGNQGRVDPSATFIHADIRDDITLRQTFQEIRPDVVYHLAAQVDVRASMRAPAVDAEINILGTVNVLESARLSRARVIFASSGGAVYKTTGPGAQVPALESSPISPLSPYGVSKLSAERYVRLHSRRHRIPHVVLRLANVYGPRQDTHGEGGVIAIWAGAAARGEPIVMYGDGTQTRDFIYVGDVATAFMAAGHAARTTLSSTWNVGTGTETRINDLAALFGKVTQADARPGEVHRSAIDATRITRDLGWVQTVTLEDGTARVLWWVKDGEPIRGHHL